MDFLKDFIASSSWTTLAAACAAFDAQGFNGYTLAERQANPKQNIIRPPGYAVQETI